MGPAETATVLDLSRAYQLGVAIAEQGWVLLTGGRQAGVMAAASQGAKAAGGLTLGILPGGDGAEAAEGVDIAIVTDLGQARNNINVLTADVTIACGMGLGTASEIALALKAGKQVILLADAPEAACFFQGLAGDRLKVVATVEAALDWVKAILHELQTGPRPRH
ncbi:MAG: cytochrome [Chloroflexaceae bacterium]|nr:cytochrome [Chloroflexaceae bacterium]